MYYCDITKQQDTEEQHTDDMLIATCPPRRPGSHCDLQLVARFLTCFSALHEVDEHVVDAGSLCQHQGLERKNKPWLDGVFFFSQCRNTIVTAENHLTASWSFQHFFPITSNFGVKDALGKTELSDKSVSQTVFNGFTLTPNLCWSV